MRVRSAVCLGVLSTAAAAAHAQDPAREGYSPVQALAIVDCLLPGQVRSLGGRTYLTQRRPARLTAEECRKRGGEYLVYDRADYRSALNVWLPTAEGGDAEAQTIVGEIYERGLGTEPDYVAAVRWYRRAADQGYSRAQFNLGTLYESGLGVEEDRLEALNWYRLSSGLGEDSLIYRAAAAAEQEALRSRLLEEIEQRDRQIDVLRRQVEELNRQLRAVSENSASVRAELESIVALLDQLESLQASEQERLAALSVEQTQSPRRTFDPARAVSYRRRDFGRFYALIIGVQDYDLLDDLMSPANDAAQLAEVLEQRYGFSVITLANPDQMSLARAINQLSETLEEDDNLLIYFSGHGSRLRSGPLETGYWLPTNAEPAPNDTFWVSNEFVSRHLGRIQARRVLVVADSCYAGMLGNDPGYVMIGDGEYTDEYIEWKMPKRARLVLSSGLDQPVVGEDDNEHSIFARALLAELSENERVLTAPELFLRVRQRIRRVDTTPDKTPRPELRALKDAGHEVGDFFLIPTESG